MIRIATIKYVNSPRSVIREARNEPLRKTLPKFFSELPVAPEYDPVARAMAKTTDSEIAATVRLISSMSPSTGVLANPIRYHQRLECSGVHLEMDVLRFTIRCGRL